MKSKYTRKRLLPIVKQSKSIASVCQKLGLKISGGSAGHIKKIIRQNNISTKHFLGQAINKGKKSTRRKSWNKRLILSGKKEHGYILRQSLIDYGRPYICSNCVGNPIWVDQELNLIVDHINGDNTDHRPKNLRFLCPNCHSQTETFAGRNKGRMAKRQTHPV